MTSGDPFQLTWILNFGFFWCDREKDRLSWNFNSSGKQFFAGWHLYFVSFVWNCSANGQVTLFSKYSKSKKNLRYTDNFPTVLYMFRGQITWHSCNIFCSEISQCITVINKSNLSSCTNGKLRDRTWFWVPEEVCGRARNIIWCLDSHFSTLTSKQSFPFIYNWW